MSEYEMVDADMQESFMDDDLQSCFEFGRILGEMARENEDRQRYIEENQRAMQRAMLEILACI